MKARILASALLSLLLLAGCSDDDNDNNDNNDNNNNNNGNNNGNAGSNAGNAGSNAGGGGDGMAGERMITLVATEFMFSPDAITASAGDTLIVTLRNDGAVDHSLEFEIGEDEFKLDSNVAPGDSAQLTVPIPDDANGDYPFYCPISGHRALGMEGTLTVQ